VGIRHNIPFLSALMNHPRWREGKASTGFVEAAAVAKGDNARPRLTKTAKTGLTSRRKSISYHPTGLGTLEGRRLRIFANGRATSEAQHDPDAGSPEFCAWIGGHGTDP
jgi:acetyl/propionyl-CoA carboxylase alpha subunit